MANSKKKIVKSSKIATKRDVVKPDQSPTKKPYLSAALIVDRVLTDKEDGVVSLMRIIDTITIPSHQVELVKQMPEQRIGTNLTIVTAFQGAGFKGDYPLLVVGFGPSGKNEPVSVSILPFNGAEVATFNAMSKLIFIWDGEGVYWFEVRLNNEYITRIPLMVKVAQPTIVDQE